MNDAAASIHGVARLDVRPNAYSETYSLFQEDGRPYPTYELPLAWAVRGETVKDARWRIRRQDGVEVLAVGTAQPLIGVGGRRIGAVLTLRDDTAREAAIRSLQKSKAACGRPIGCSRREVGNPRRPKTSVRSRLPNV